MEIRWSERWKLDFYELGDIYNVFLVGDFKATQKTSTEREIREEVRVAAMLSYNGLGEKKDILFARISQDTLASANKDEIKYVHFDDTQGLDEVTFECWLSKLDAQVDRNILVIIGPDTWKLLNINDSSKPLQKLRFVTVMNIGDTYHGILPEKCPEIEGLYPAIPLALGAEARISHDNILSSLSQKLQEIDVGFKSTSFLTLAGQSSCLRGQQCTCLSDKVSESIRSSSETI
ncbi:hypothetical protein BGZ80_011146 [Entomortierella chlamydospora]|uniref:Uncharacterized protein n=1 Tax=Entomortierella chlamydospora TaxID=101097 RepID=A0A9P6SZ88_9FUNG|nr:hypothetical protein BGZ80_011146 [Entomortierella chlamydospora]